MVYVVLRIGVKDLCVKPAMQHRTLDSVSIVEMKRNTCTPSNHSYGIASLVVAHFDRIWHSSNDPNVDIQSILIPNSCLISL